MTTLSRFKKIFPFLGLSDKSFTLYEIIVKQGPLAASLLAKELTIPRATVYLELEKLRDNRLIAVTGSIRKRKYIAESNEALIQLLEEKSRNFTNLIPLAHELGKEVQEYLFTKNKKNPEINFFQGKEAVIKFFEATLHTKSKEMRSIVPINDLLKHLGTEYIDDFVKRRIKKGVLSRVIWPKDMIPYPSLIHHNEQLRKVRFLPSGITFRCGFITFDDYVYIFTSVDDLFCIQVRSKDLSQGLANLFDFIWENAEKPDEK